MPDNRRRRTICRCVACACVCVPACVCVRRCLQSISLSRCLSVLCIRTSSAAKRLDDDIGGAGVTWAAGRLPCLRRSSWTQFVNALDAAKQIILISKSISKSMQIHFKQKTNIVHIYNSAITLKSKKQKNWASCNIVTYYL